MKRTKMLVNLDQEIIKCKRCPRLLTYRNFMFIGKNGV